MGRVHFWQQKKEQDASHPENASGNSKFLNTHFEEKIMNDVLQIDKDGHFSESVITAFLSFLFNLASLMDFYNKSINS